MLASHRVEDKENVLTGFIVEGKYIGYYSVLSDIELIDNLGLDSNGKICPRGENLPSVAKREVNRYRYQALCRDNILERDIQAELAGWKARRRDYVLYVTGARQIGKTTEILKFAFKNYEQIIYVNLAAEKAARELEKAVDSGSLYLGMVKFCRAMGLEEYRDSEDTILIIDEIQESVLIYNNIRALQSGLKCDIAVTGSYLGKTLHSEYFKPAGNVWRLEMLPLSFAEFCHAFSSRNLLETVDIRGGDSKGNYNILYELYKVYVQIGGYPAVVAEYKESGSLTACMQILKRLIQTFTEESAAYFTDAKSRVIFENVYKEAFRMIAYEKKGTSARDVEKITQFVRESTKEHVSRGEVGDAVSWLKYSGMIGGCDLYNQGEVSDLLHERRFFFMDCGIANCIAQMSPVDNETVKGILAENFAYTELYRLYQSDKVKGDKPCCSVYQNYELDFMVVDKADKKYGIEIKTSDQGEPISLMVYLEHKKIDAGYVAGKTKGGVRKKICSIPIYAVGCRFPYN